MYVKLIEGQIQEAPKNKGSIINYNSDIEAMVSDGYKLFIEAQIPQTNRMYHYEYVENIDNISEVVVYDETQEEADLRELNQAKQDKIQENDTVRDTTLNQGVEYKGVLFDSDTDQKVNLMATIEMLPEGTTVVWYGMDNQPLTCTKEDLYNIGGLITQLHSFCWNKNALIKGEINKATTIEQVNAIVIDYSMD